MLQVSFLIKFKDFRIIIFPLLRIFEVIEKNNLKEKKIQNII